MNNKHSTFKRYVYISERKIGMYDRQITRSKIQKLWELLFHITSIKVGPVALGFTGKDTQTHQMMQEIIARIEKEHAIGTIDQPAEYIHDTLPLFSVLIPSRPGYRRAKDDPGFVYYGGGTQTTSIALVGSVHHLIGQHPKENAPISSDMPGFVAYLNERLNEVVPTRKTRGNHGLGAIWYADQYNSDPRTHMEFFAYRMNDSNDMKRITPLKRLLLYTPIYVAYAS